MYTLYSAVPAFGARAASPFAVKAESMLRLSGVPFERENTTPNTGPRGKLPYLKCPDGTIISDSWNIQQHLVAQAGLDLAPCALDTLIRRTVEEHLYFAQMYFRWTLHLDEVETALFGDVPWPIRKVVFPMVRRQVRGSLHGQGLGRRPVDETLAVVSEDLDALEAALGAGPFFGGPGLSAADLATHGILDQIVPSVFDDVFIQAVRARRPLVDYYRRVDAALYGAAARQAA